MSVHGRWPLTTGVAQGRYYCSYSSRLPGFSRVPFSLPPFLPPSMCLIVLDSNNSQINPHIHAKFGRSPTVVLKQLAYTHAHTHERRARTPTCQKGREKIPYILCTSVCVCVWVSVLFQGYFMEIAHVCLINNNYVIMTITTPLEDGYAKVFMACTQYCMHLMKMYSSFHYN